MAYSPFVIKGLVDTITGGGGNDATPPIGIYGSGPKIEQFFLDCGIDMRIGSSSRLPATTDALRLAAGQYNGDELLTRTLERVADPCDFIADETKGRAVLDHLNRILDTDGLAIVIVNGKVRVVPRGTVGVAVTTFTAKVRVLDFDTVELDIAHALANTATDAEDAVTAACSLLESVCHSILIELGLPLPPKKDIGGLIRAVQEPLNLSPSRTDLPTEIEAGVRQVLGGLTSVSKGIGALRAHAGDAHSREKGFKRTDARIARLAVTAASSIALFLIEIWKQQHRALPLREENHASAA